MSSVGDIISPTSLVLRNVSRSYHVIIAVIIIIISVSDISIFNSLETVAYGQTWTGQNILVGNSTECLCANEKAWLISITIINFILVNFNIIIIPKSRLESGEYGCKASNSEGEGFSRPFALAVQRKPHAVHASIF